MNKIGPVTNCAAMPVKVMGDKPAATCGDRLLAQDAAEDAEIEDQHRSEDQNQTGDVQDFDRRVGPLGAAHELAEGIVLAPFDEAVHTA